ncbi:type IV secretory system conjugative DNA transfer family protein [Mycobacterium kansasii]
MSHPEPYTPYCGLVIDTKGRPVRAPGPGKPGAPHLAISAPTRSGKTQGLLAPAAVLHPGPAVCVSSKPDLAELVVPIRSLGVTGVIDLQPEKTPGWPAGVRPMVTDPTRSITNAQEALTVAETMLATAGVGFGGTSSGTTVAAGGLWEATASRPLACLLYAASPEGNNLGMPWVLEAVENLGTNNDDGPAALAKPSWMMAYSLCPHPMLAEPLASVLTRDGRIRDSVVITASKAVTPWVRLGLSSAANPLDAIEEMTVESFDPAMLDEPDATLFVIAPNTGTVAGAAVALIDSIVRRWRRKTARHEMTHRLLLELDEVCNSCPLPALLNYVGESAGLGVNILATVQAFSQFDVVYGPKYADALRDVFPGTLIMHGAHERHLLEQASHWAGLSTRRTEAYEPDSGSRGQSSNFGPAIEWQDFLPQGREEGRLLLRGTPGTAVWLPGWTQFLQIFDQAIQRRIDKGRARRPAASRPTRV